MNVSSILRPQTMPLEIKDKTISRETISTKQTIHHHHLPWETLVFRSVVEKLDRKGTLTMELISIHRRNNFSKRVSIASILREKHNIIY